MKCIFTNVTHNHSVTSKYKHQHIFVILEVNATLWNVLKLNAIQNTYAFIDVITVKNKIWLSIYLK